MFNILLLKMASAFQPAAQGYLRRSQPAMAFANRGCRYPAEISHPRCIVRTPSLHHSGIGRIQLIRRSTDAGGTSRFRRLELTDLTVREKVLRAFSDDELAHIFDTDGFFE